MTVPECVFGLRRVNVGDRLKCPVMGGLFEEPTLITQPRELGFAEIVGRTRRPATDPFDQQTNCRLVELAVRRHLQVFVFVGDGVEQQRCVHLARDDGLLSVAALEPSGTAVQQQPTLLFAGFFGMTLVAMGSQQGADFFLEEFKTARGSGVLRYPSFSHATVSSACARSMHSSTGSVMLRRGSLRSSLDLRSIGHSC